MEYRIEVYWQADVPDGRAAGILAQIAQLGIDGVQGVQVSDLYFCRGETSRAQVEHLAVELLADPIVEAYRVQPVDEMPESATTPVVEVGFRPGVTDPVATHLLQRAHMLGITGVQATSTGTRYVFQGNVSTDDLQPVSYTHLTLPTN